MARGLGIGEDDGVAFLATDGDRFLCQLEDLAGVPDDQCGT
jgi:hypothetical protein